MGGRYRVSLRWLMIKRDALVSSACLMTGEKLKLSEDAMTDTQGAQLSDSSSDSFDFDLDAFRKFGLVDERKLGDLFGDSLRTE